MQTIEYDWIVKIISIPLFSNKYLHHTHNVRQMKGKKG